MWLKCYRINDRFDLILIDLDFSSINDETKIGEISFDKFALLGVEPQWMLHQKLEHNLDMLNMLSYHLL